MKAHEQRIAIAEACGWTVGADPTGKYDLIITDPNGIQVEWARANGRTWDEMLRDQSSALPDYLNSLDAMAEAEKALTDNQWDRYEADLWAIVAPGEIVQPSMPLRFARRFLSATAAQRAEAFLRTLGKYTAPTK